MKYLLSLGLALCSFMILIGQPGIYSESDMEFQDMFFEAQLAKYKGDTDGQIEALNKVLKRDKDSHAAYYELSKTYKAIANYELAEKYAKKANSLSNGNEWYLLNLADILELRNEYGQAITVYQNLQKLSPQNPVIYHRLALLQLKSGKGQAAAQTLEALQQKDGVDEETSRRIFDIYRDNGNQKKAVETLKNLIAAIPDSPRLMNNLASYYMETGQEKEAQKIYDQILKLDPKDPNASMAVAKRNIGDSTKDANLSALMPLIENVDLPLDNKIKELMPYLSTMKKTGQTTDDLEAISSKLVSLYPNEAKAHALKGDILFYQGKYTDSESSFKKAIQLDDRNYALWSQYMQCLWELEEIGELETVSEEAIDLYPNKVTAFLFHAISLKKSDPQAAQDFTTEAQFIAGNNKSLTDRVAIVRHWITGHKTSQEELSSLDYQSFGESLYLELAGDLYASIDKKNAQKLWKQAIQLGANPDRLYKKIELQ